MITRLMHALLLFFVSCNAIASMKISPGEAGQLTAEIRISSSASCKVEVSVVTFESQSKLSRTAFWGADGSYEVKTFPSQIELFVNGKNVFVPLSVYVDLGDLRSIELIRDRSGCIARLRGSQTSLSYIAEIRFDATGVLTRRVMSALFSKEVYEKTEYRNKLPKGM